jgi:hypothetical protein
MNTVTTGQTRAGGFFRWQFAEEVLEQPDPQMRGELAEPLTAQHLRQDEPEASNARNRKEGRSVPLELPMGSAGSHFRTRTAGRPVVVCAAASRTPDIGMPSTPRDRGRMRWVRVLGAGRPTRELTARPMCNMEQSTGTPRACTGARLSESPVRWGVKGDGCDARHPGRRGMRLQARSVALRAGVVAVIVMAGLVRTAHAVPSFARQTGMTCQACHTIFPELTPFGRLFKLNGYQIDNLPQVQGITPSKDLTLLLNYVPPLSLMFETSFTKTGAALPDSHVPAATAQNGQVLFPQQASLFYAGRVAPNLGSFIQITYDSASGTLHWDNTEIRYAKQVGSGAQGITFGMTLNNNPSMQDVWNSTPAWQTPFDQKTNAAPVPGAATQIDGGLAGRGVFGLTGYIWLKNSIYAEGGLYRSSPQGFNVNGLAGPLDSTTGGVVTGAAPYWRLAAEHQWARNVLSIGGYGMTTSISGAEQPIGPPTDKFSDVAIDGQYQFIGDAHIVSVQTTFIHERQSLDQSVVLGAAANPSNDLKTARLGGSYYFRRTYGGALGVFSTSGSADTGLYQAAPVFGFGTNSPNSHGWLGELTYVPWQNVKLVMQYVSYQKFNGASANYDGTGRNAKDNNTLYLLGWFAF